MKYIREDVTWQILKLHLDDTLLVTPSFSVDAVFFGNCYIAMATPVNRFSQTCDDK